MTYLSSGDACRDMATVLASRLFIRSDVKESHLPIFLDWVKLVIIENHLIKIVLCKFFKMYTCIENIR